MLAGCTVCFFKQKTAYEVRISDWSSDVCSSDLPGALADVLGGEEGLEDTALDLFGDARAAVGDCQGHLLRGVVVGAAGGEHARCRDIHHRLLGVHDDVGDDLFELVGVARPRRRCRRVLYRLEWSRGWEECVSTRGYVWLP